MIWNIRKPKPTNQNKKKKKSSQTNKQISKQKNNKDRVRSIWDNFQRFNICIMEVPEGQEKEQEIGNLFEKIMTENFPNLVKEIDIQVQEAQRVPDKLDPETHSKTHHS